MPHIIQIASFELDSLAKGEWRADIWCRGCIGEKGWESGFCIDVYV